VVAQGQAKANDALSRSISPILVQYKSVEKWNGVLPQVSGGPFLLLTWVRWAACRPELKEAKNELRVQSPNYSRERKHHGKNR